MASISSMIPTSAGMANSAINFGRTAANNTQSNMVAGGQMGQSVGAIQGSVAQQ